MAETVFNEGSINGTDFRIESDDNANMFFVDGADDRIGIGTASPASLLHVKTTANASETIRIQNDDSLTTVGVSSDGYSFHTYQHSLYWASWDGSTWSTKARMDNDGNLGILTTSPNVGSANSERGVLTISSTDNGSANNYAVLEVQGHSINSDGALGVVSFLDHSTNCASIQVNTEDSSQSSGKMLFLTKAAGGSITERMRIASGGKVAINSNNPAGQLPVKGSGELLSLETTAGTGTNLIMFSEASSNKSFVGYGSDSNDDFAIYQYENANLKFATNSAERMRITSNGDIELVTDETHIHMQTSDGSDNKSWSICGGGGDSTTRGAIVSLAGNEDGEDGKLRLYAGNASNNNGMIHFHTGNSVHVGKFDYNGDFYSNDGTIHNLSDKRGKKDIQDLSDGLDIVKKLKPVTYKWNGKADMGEDDDVTRYGFVADDVLEVASQYVGITKAKLDGEDVDDYKTISMLKMFPMLMKAVQELSAKVEDLEKKNVMRFGN